MISATATPGVRLAQGRLWQDDTIFEARHRKSAAALVAIRDVLRELRSGQAAPLAPAIDEFCHLFDWCKTHDPQQFTRAWNDHYAYYWVRIAYQLTGHLASGLALGDNVLDCCKAIGATDPAHALALHLHAFKRLALAQAVLAGEDLRLETPLDLELPFALPATPLGVHGEGTVSIDGVDAGKLRCHRNGMALRLPPVAGHGEQAGLSIQSCPQVTLDEWTLCLQAEAFNNLPGLDFVQPVLAAGSAFHTSNQPLVARTLELVRQHQPGTLAQMQASLHVVGLKPLRSANYTNITYSDLPGSFIAAIINNPWELADTFIHEFHHQRLFFLEEEGAFFQPGEQLTMKDASYYSPWRDDLRPLHGVLHAVYVYAPVARFWLSVADSGDTPSGMRDYAIERLRRIRLQMQLGLEQLGRHAQLSEQGAALFATLADDVHSLDPVLAAAAPDGRIPALRCREDGGIEPEPDPASGGQYSVDQAVLSHVQRFAPASQCEHLLARLHGLGALD